MSPGTLVGYEGGIDNPMSWDRVVEKFHWLSEAFADENLRNRIIQAVQKLDVQPISELMLLLGQLRPSAVFPKTHPAFSRGSSRIGETRTTKVSNTNESPLAC